MKNILIIYGGKSVEHDISIITAIQTMETINKKLYSYIPVYITKKGEFVVLNDYKNIEIYKTDIKKYKNVEFIFGHSKIKVGKIGKKISIDCIINCCHGKNGEDGFVSVLASMLNTPCTCSNLISSAICMDKIYMKNVFNCNNINCMEYTWTTKDEYVNNSKYVIEKITKLMDYPLIIKPSNLGSSIGIGVANNDDELAKCIELAINYDSRVIVEKCLENMKEINCSVFNNNGEVVCSLLEQPCGWKQFLKFSDKYLSGTKDMLKRKINPNIDELTKQKIYEMSKKIYSACDCFGVVRIDFMLDEKQNIFANEINTVPGSLAFYLWEKKGVYFKNLIDNLIESAIKKHVQDSSYVITYTSNVLNGFKDLKMNKYAK